MGKSYSLDLRLRVVGALDASLSKRQAHQTFHVSRSTIDDWLKLRAQTGSLQVPRAARAAGDNPRALSAQTSFSAFAQRHQHSTLEQMRAAWAQETQQSWSTMSFSRALRASGYTRKKRVIFIKSDGSQSAPSLPRK